MSYQHEFLEFHKASKREKIDALYGYLVEGGNMADVCDRYDLKHPKRVSHITRGYGFADRNSRIFGEGSQFHRNTGIVVSRKDIEAYVNRFPDAVPSDQGKSKLEQFLLQRHGLASGQYQGSSAGGGSEDSEFLGCIGLVIILFLLWKFIF